MRLCDLYYMNRHDRRILLALLVVAVIALGLVFLIGREEIPDSSESFEESRFTGNLSYSGDSVFSPTDSRYYAHEEQRAERFLFDPNTADSTQLLRLGLKPWQVRNIYRYREAGGVFRQKEDFARLHGLTVKEYRELEPYIRISFDYLPAATLVDKEEPYVRDTLRYPVKMAEGETVDLNVADTTLFRKVPGIGSYYARKIVDYGERLGGYVSIDQLDEIEGFPQAAKHFFVVQDTGVRKLRINYLSLNELKRHPYISYYQARAITDYCRVHGPIHNLRELGLLTEFPQEAIDRLEPYVSYE